MNLEHIVRIFSLTAGCLGLACSLATAGDLPQVGQQAPDVTLPSQDGSNVSLNDFRGKWVVLYFYPKDNTPGCTIEAHNFQRDLSKYDEKNAVIRRVGRDSRVRPRPGRARDGGGGEAGRRGKQPAAAEAAAAAAREACRLGVGCGGHA